MTREREGGLLCLLAAVAYSVTAPFAKLAYAADVNVVTLLSVRYVIAATCFWLLIARTGRSLPPRSTITRGLLLGLICQSGQTFLFASALKRIDAALAILLLYAYPAMITVAAVVIGRERLTLPPVIALLVATTGVALVLSGSRGGAVDMVGIALALGAAVVYTITLLTGHAILRATPPFMLGALVATGAAITFTTAGVASNSIRFDFKPWGWLPIIGLALCASILATVANYAGITRVGPTVASILGTMEIPLGVLFATVLLGERLLPIQVIGGLLVLSAVLLLQARRPGSRVPDVVAAEPESSVVPSIAP